MARLFGKSSLRRTLRRPGRLVMSFAERFNSRLYLSLIYYRIRGRWPNFCKPSDISEIILSQILTGEINRFSQYADKLEVRKHLQAWGYDKYLPKLFGVWTSADDIELDSLPERFVLKTNHGCGVSLICVDKSKFDFDAAKHRLNQSIETEYDTYETQYHGIAPFVFAEEFVDEGTGLRPMDYKFMCCDGDVRCILLVAERFDSSYKLVTYDRAWQKLDYVVGSYLSSKIVEKPDNLEEMLKIASDIASKFKQVRVDLYNVAGRIFIGELTFTPQGGQLTYFTDEAIRRLGSGND